MIMVPLGLLVLIVGALPVVGLTCYWYGWKLRGKHMPRVTLGTMLTSPRMTTREEERMCDAFDHLSKAYDAIRDFYREQ